MAKPLSNIAKGLLKKAGKAATKNKAKGAAATKRVRDRAAKAKAIAKSKAISKNVKAKKSKQLESLGKPSAIEENLSREIKEGSRSEKISVGKGVGGIDIGRFNPRELVAGSKEQKEALKKVIAIESKGKAATNKEKAFAKAYRKFYADRENKAITKRAISRSASARKAKPADDFSDALKAAKETGEITPAYERLTPNQQAQIDRSVEVSQQLKRDVGARRKVTERLRNQAKSRTGNMDFRKGGLILSSVDNRKKKK